MVQKSYDDSPSLYLIPTPIGNLDDITYRSLKVLESVDLLLCEDTRETQKLLNHFGINKKVKACHEFNEEKIKDNIISLLKEGNNLGLVTDQGTPIISDPGYIVSKEVINAGYNVISLPGATAFVPALTMSGIEPSPFMFYGFLDNNIINEIDNKRVNKDYKITPKEDDLYSFVRLEDINQLLKDSDLKREIILSQDGCSEYIKKSINKMNNNV